jgi:putative CocE/NonD family hydrolase
MTSPMTPFTRWRDRAMSLTNEFRFEIGIPMRDGVELAADVYLPREVTGGSVPAIVQVTPYDKESPLFCGDEGVFYQDNGYAFVAVDVRGRGKSEGDWHAFVNDPEDTYDVIEWVAAQEWCDGQVGTTGLSYMGWVQWAAASQRPPHLAAMVSTSAAGRWQQEIPFTNGVFQLYFAWWAFVTRRRIADVYRLEREDWDVVLRTLPLDALGEIINPSGPTWDDVVGRDVLDDFWRQLRFDDRYDQIDVPCLHVTGWYDLEDLLGAFHHYENMILSSPSRDRQQLIVGPWSHVKSRFPDRDYGGIDFGESAALDMSQQHLRWFDHWLKGRDNGVAADPRVRIFEPGTNRWRTADSWPLADSSRTLFLTAAGELSRQAPAVPGERSFRYDPADPVLTGLDVRQYPFEDVPLEQTANEARPDVLSWTGEELTEDVTVSGWATLELFALSDCTDTDWHVKLTDVHPDGRSVKVTQGCLRAACRDSLESPEPLVPGEVYRFPVELWPTHHVFRAGHRIRVTVTSSDFPWFARSLNQFGPIRAQHEIRVATNTIRCDGSLSSRLHLPVERPHQGADVVDRDSAGE